MLDNFIEYTNYCENKGYEFETIQSRKGITCDLYKDGKLLKVGTKVYESCLIAQKECYTLLFKKLQE